MLFTRFLCPESLAACVLILCPGTKRGNCVAPFCARAQNEARSWAQNGGGHKTRVVENLVIRKKIQVCRHDFAPGRKTGTAYLLRGWICRGCAERGRFGVYFNIVLFML